MRCNLGCGGKNPLDICRQADCSLDVCSELSLHAAGSHLDLFRQVKSFVSVFYSFLETVFFPLCPLLKTLKHELDRNRGCLLYCRPTLNSSHS